MNASVIAISALETGTTRALACYFRRPRRKLAAATGNGRSEKVIGEGADDNMRGRVWSPLTSGDHAKLANDASAFERLLAKTCPNGATFDSLGTALINYTQICDGRIKEGRCMIAHVHEGTMTSGFPRLIGSSWASADTFRRSVGIWRVRFRNGLGFCV